MEEKKKNNSLLIVWIIILLIVMVIMGIYMYKINNEKQLAQEKANDLSCQVATLNDTATSLQTTINNISAQLNNVSNTIENSSTNNSTTSNTEKSQEEIVKELYLEQLKEDNEKNSEKLVDYRVDKVSILTGTEREKLIDDLYTNASSSDIFANVTYSVKPKDVNNTLWVAGNGEISGNWIINKSACVYIAKENGSYVIKSNGTGW